MLDTELTHIAVPTMDAYGILTRLDDSTSGDEVFTNDIASMRWSYQFTPRFTLRLITNYEKTRTNPDRTRLGKARTSSVTSW